jgi:hypothetical protein
VIESRVRGAVALPLASLCAAIVAVVFTVSFLVSGPVHRIPPGFALAAWSAWAIVMVLRRRLTAPVGNRSRLLSALVALVAVWAGLYAFRPALHAGDGLAADYFPNATWSGTPSRTIDPVVSTEIVDRRWRSSTPPQFSIVWSGFLSAARSGLYTFTTTSDDGSELWIDGMRVVDNRGTHSAATRAGNVHLERGAHPLLLRYNEVAAASVMEWTWSVGGARPTAIPAWALSQRPPSPARVVAVRLMDTTSAIVAVLLILAGVWSIAIETPFWLRVLPDVMSSASRAYVSMAALVVSAVIVVTAVSPPGRELLTAGYETFVEVHGTALSAVSRFRAFQHDLNSPRSGEEVAIPERVRAMVAVLDRRGLTKYRLSASIASNDWVFQQMVATAWPRTLEPAASTLFLLTSEPIPDGCTVIDQEAEVSLAACP